MKCPACGHALTAADMPAPLTRQQHELYAFLVGHIAEYGYAPSQREIADVFGFASLSTVHEHLTNIERKGWIARRYNESRGITCLVELPKPAPALTLEYFA